MGFPMRIAFAGTPAFAATVLAKLLNAQHKIVLVLTQPDRPSGRGLRPTASAVKDFAVKQGLEVRQPVTLKDSEALDFLAKARPEAIVTAAYGLILPAPVLELVAAHARPGVARELVRAAARLRARALPGRGFARKLVRGRRGAREFVQGAATRGPRTRLLLRRAL